MLISIHHATSTEEKLMTHYQLEHHQQLFELGWWDAFNDLSAVLPLPDKT
jgi:hypothetical protein